MRKRKRRNKRNKKKTDKFLNSWEWRTLRYKVLQEFGSRCMCCGATSDDGETKICVDHIRPRHKYPHLALQQSNLQVLCDACNMGKGAWDETDFRNNLEDYQDDHEREIQMRLVDQAKLLQ